MVHEILQEDDLISKIILEAYKATKIIASVESDNRIEESRPRQQAQATRPPQSTNSVNKSSEFETWKKIINHKPKEKPDFSEYNLFNENVVPIERVMSKEQPKQQEITSFEDLLNQPAIDPLAPDPVEPDSALMNMFAKKYKRGVK